MGCVNGSTAPCRLILCHAHRQVVAVELDQSEHLIPCTPPDDEDEDDDDGDDGRVDRKGVTFMGERRPKRFLVHYRSWSRRWDEWLEPSR